MARQAVCGQRLPGCDGWRTLPGSSPMIRSVPFRVERQTRPSGCTPGACAAQLSPPRHPHQTIHKPKAMHPGAAIQPGMLYRPPSVSSSCSGVKMTSPAPRIAKNSPAAMIRPRRTGPFGHSASRVYEVQRTITDPWPPLRGQQHLGLPPPHTGTPALAAVRGDGFARTM